ncbi:MAG: DUF6516 family protein [Candidatus Bipolaricaulota bacterium]|nr:DUF6516 family protein [Candidatus Bipolaricaulota bacterium]MCS7274543.1 DUF6516 family protein [Candidatus Bipolaricaulota bacterium]MDW8111212.1 DUF6516 family protein [Candidatus Bipolaricaulota bacterium]MDW8329457.1 DUF6516 family protein [Candidatus Bipolaricaulota bacterium]
MWYVTVKAKLERSRLFRHVEIIGAKVRASISADLFLDIYYDPISRSYSYALVDTSLPGDKRLFGWDDYPHEHVPEIRRLTSYPHHFQHRQGSRWIFEESPMRGDVEREISLVIRHLRAYLKQRASKR